MEATPARVIQYFHGEKQSLIPLFQRPYSWNKENWETLWNDIIVQYDSEETQTHFMGAIVSVPARSVPVGVSKHLIIDGQQRLTTITIILCALRDILDENTAARIHEVYLVNKFREPEDTLKFVPTQLDRAVYKSIVIDREAPDSKNLMGQSYNFFISKLRSSSDGNAEKIDPQKILTIIEHSLQVVMINIGESDDPYLIFESLNFKGQPLTQADLVRNYLLMRFKHSISSGGEQERVHEKYWLPIQTKLQTRITDFLRHYSMKDGENINQGGIYVSVKQKFRNIEDAADVENKISEMKVFADYYSIILKPETEANSKISRSLSRIAALEVTTSYPLLMQLLSSCKAGNLSVDEFCECVSLIESFIVRRNVCGVPTNALNKLFLQWCRAYPASGQRKWLHSTISSGNAGRRFPTDEELREAFKHQPQYGRGTTRYVLISLERSFTHKEPVDLSSATIEHILPQTLNDKWRQTLGPDAELIQARVGDTMGNLSLTAYNTELGNLPFNEKKEKFKESHIDLNKSIIDEINWGEKEILIRSEFLFLRALQIWPGPLIANPQNQQ